MANAMNFRAAVTPPNRSTPIARNPNPRYNPAANKPRMYGNMPIAPKNTGNKNEYNVLMDLYRKNQKTYNSAKRGKKWKESYIKTGGGYVKSDFGEGNRGAAIPYTVGQRDQIRLTDKIAETSEEAKVRKAKEAAEAAAKKAKEDAIKRRQKKKK